MRREELMAIAQQATFLAERATSQWVPDSGAAQQAAAQTRLQRWCQLAAGGDWTHFAERLAWDGLDLTQAQRLLTDGQRADWTEPPAWTACLAEVVAQCAPVGSATEPMPLLNALLTPFVSVAQARLQQAVGVQWLWLTPTVQAKLTDLLRQQLVDLAAPTITYITRAGSPTQLVARQLTTLCHAYPVLARQLVNKVMQWVDSCAEFLARLAADWPLLISSIGQTTTLAAGAIADLCPGLSDPHAGGRTVWAVTLTDPAVGGTGSATTSAGTTIAYKPKALMLDQAWNALICWCNDQGLSPRLGHLWTLPRAGYGWMEWANLGLSGAFGRCMGNKSRSSGSARSGRSCLARWDYRHQSSVSLRRRWKLCLAGTQLHRGARRKGGADGADRCWQEYAGAATAGSLRPGPGGDYL